MGVTYGYRFLRGRGGAAGHVRAGTGSQEAVFRGLRPGAVYAVYQLSDGDAILSGQARADAGGNARLSFPGQAPVFAALEGRVMVWEEGEDDSTLYFRACQCLERLRPPLPRQVREETPREEERPPETVAPPPEEERVPENVAPPPEEERPLENVASAPVSLVVGKGDGEAVPEARLEKERPDLPASVVLAARQEALEPHAPPERPDLPASVVLAARQEALEPPTPPQTADVPAPGMGPSQQETLEPPLPSVASAEEEETLPGETEMAEYSLRPAGMGEPVDALTALIWPPAAAELKIYFETLAPIAPFDAPGWRFVRAPSPLRGVPYCAIGYHAQDSRVTQVAYAIPGTPQRAPAALPGYRYQVGRGGEGYWTLWRKVEA